MRFLFVSVPIDCSVSAGFPKFQENLLCCAILAKLAYI